MAFLTMTQALYAVLIFIAYRVIYSIYRSRTLNAFAKAQGCEQPHNITKWPWPLSVIEGFAMMGRFMRMKETGEDILDDIIGDQFKDASTIRQTQFDGSMQLITNEPANLQAILATQFKDFEIGQRRISTFYPLLKKSIFSSDGADWEHSRALFRPQFNREYINDLDATEESSQALIAALGPPDANNWTRPVDLQPLFFDFTLDTATSFLFGESVNSLGKNATNQQFKDDFELVSMYMIHRIRLQAYYWLCDGIKFRQAVSRIRKFTEQFVTKAVSKVDDDKEGKKYDLLSALARETRDREELRDQTMAILAAGRDTTASLLGWCFLRLSLHPTILHTLRQTILQHFPPHEPITFAKLKDCRPLQHFLNEILRLHPTVPFNNRTAAKTTTLPCGGGADGTSPILIPEGQTVAFSVYLMHRRKDLWGEDALEFKPERWSERKVPAWQYLPFSGGPRICLGQQFALTETSYVIVRMLQSFDKIEPVDREEMGRMRKMLGLTMWPMDGVKVRLHRAES